MNVTVALLLASGALALLSGAVVLLWKPNRVVSLLAAAALLLLGLQQLGWARAIDAISWGDRNYWLDLSLVFAMPLSLAWLLLAVVLARETEPEQARVWRLYVSLQALLSLGAVAGLHWFSPLGRFLVEGNRQAVPLTSFAVLLLGNLLLNATFLSANLESTYLGLSARWRRVFRPVLAALVLLCGSWFYLAMRSTLTGRLSFRDLALTSIPVALLAAAAPVAFVRNRMAEASVTAQLKPFYETASFVVGIAAIVLLLALVQIAHATGWTLARAFWISTLCVALLGLGAVAMSRHLRGGLQRLVEPFLYTSRFDPEAVWTRLSHELDATSTRHDLCRMVPARTADIAGIGPVTLFMASSGASDFEVVASTLQPVPAERVAREDPLARELRASRHAIHLRGRAHDLGLIPIYVENAKQIAACEAACAVPLNEKGELLGFMLCGDPDRGRETLAGTLLLLEVVAQMVTTRLTSFRGDR
jgi:hypothetical protein